MVLINHIFSNYLVPFEYYEQNCDYLESMSIYKIYVAFLSLALQGKTYMVKHEL